jgi:hypothetical protein
VVDSSVLSEAESFWTVQKEVLGMDGEIVGETGSSSCRYEAMNRAIALHRLRPVIDQTFPFAEAKAAYRHFEGRATLARSSSRTAERAEGNRVPSQPFTAWAGRLRIRRDRRPAPVCRRLAAACNERRWEGSSDKELPSNRTVRR